MTKDIDRLVEEVKQNLAYYLDTSVYLPVKEELIGVENSLGIRKELLKNYINSELNRLKVAIIENAAVTVTDGKKAEQEEWTERVDVIRNGVFRNLDDVKREYFPRSYKEEKETEKVEKMTPAEKGNYFAKKTIEKINILIKRV